MKTKLEYVKNETKKGFKEFKNGTKTMFKEFFNEETNKKQRANMWSFTRLIIPIVIIITSTIAIITSSYPLFAITGAIAGLGAVTDTLDGASARKHKSTSEYGKVLDQITDKFFAGIVGINLLFINPLYICTLIGELIIAAINVGYKLKYNNLDIKSTMMGKIKTWPLYISLALGFLSPINSTMLTVANTSVVITALFQLLTANSYVKNNTEEAKKITIENIDKIELTIEEDEKIKEKELVLTKENKNTTEKLEELREFRNNLIEINPVELNEEYTNDSPKTKTLN